MAQIVQENNLGQLLGQGIGTGLSQGIQNLATQKLERMNRKRVYEEKVQGLKALRIPDAEQLAHLDDKSLQALIKAKIEEPSNQAFASSLSSLLENEQPSVNQPQNRPQSNAQSISDESFTPEVVEQLGSFLKSPEALQQFSPEQLKQVEQRLQGFSNPSAAQLQSTQQEPLIKAGLNQKQALDLTKLAIDQRKTASKEKVEEKKLSSKEKSEAFKETKEFRKEIFDAAKSARQDLHDLDRLEELNKDGKLDTPGYIEFLNRSGLSIPALMNPESQEFQKIQQGFLRQAKNYLGSRISNFELEQFLKTIPSLSQSNEGRQRVIANLKRFSRVALEYNNTLKEVIDENKGIPPLDLSQKVDDRIEKKLDKISEKFKEDLNKPVPKEQSALVTATQAALGSAAGNVGKLAKGAAGAYTGYKVGQTLGNIAGPGGGVLGGLAGGAIGGLGGLSGLL